MKSNLMDNNFDILIPDAHNQVAKFFLDYTLKLLDNTDTFFLKTIAKEIVRGKYWEAYDCQDESRQEYWRVVMNSIDTYPY